MITIYDKNGKKRFEVSVSQGSVRRYNLMKDDYIKIKFSREDNAPLAIGDYIDIEDHINSCDNDMFHVVVDPITGEFYDQTTSLYVVNRNYYPIFNHQTGGWDYDIQIDAYYKVFDSRVFRFIPTHGKAATEANFSLTDTIEAHGSLLLRNINYHRFNYKGVEYSVHFEEEVLGKGLKLINYNAITLYEAIDLIAETFECEWWFNGGSELWFGYRRGNEENKISLKFNENIANASLSKSSSTHATRLYAFGGTTNVPKHYREKIDFDVTDVYEDGIIDSNKPVKAVWFADTIEAPTTTYNVEEARVDNSSLVMSSEVKPLNTYKIGSQFFRVGEYTYTNKTIITLVRFLKLFGSNKFSLTFEYGIRLKKGDRIVKIIPYTHLFEDRISKLGGGTGTLLKQERTLGTIIETSDGYSIGETTSSFEELHRYDIAEKVVIGDASQAPIGTLPTPAFFTEKDDEINALCPPVIKRVHQHQHYIFLDNSTRQGLTVRCFQSNLWESSNRYYMLNQIDSDTVDFKIDEEGDYDIELFIDVASSDGVMTDEDGHPFVLYNAAFNNVNISFKPKAKSAKATINYTNADGKVEEEEVTINKDFRDESDPLHSLISFKGDMPIGEGDAFTFPNILRSKVAQNHGHYFMSDNMGMQTAVVQRNLMMPNGTEYVQTDDATDDNVIEAIVVYDWIYPKTEMDVLAVADAEWVEKDGEEYVITPTYEVTIKVKNFVWENMVTEGEDLYMIFQGGKTGLSQVAGLRFQLAEARDEDGKLKHTTETATFKLVPNEDYGALVPNEITRPTTTDTIILEGIDIGYFDDNAIADAEEKVKEQALLDLERVSKENIVVDITLFSNDAYDMGRLFLGQRVSLYDIFTTPYDSRVIGFEEKLDIPYDSPKYIIGESNYYSTLRNIESKLEEVGKQSFGLTGSTVGGGGERPLIIRLGENIKPTNKNIFSALRVDEDFLHTKDDDVVEGNIDFKKNISVGGRVSSETLHVNGHVAAESIDVNGDANVRGSQTIGNELIVRGQQTLHGGFITSNFNDGGGQINGAHLTADGVLTLSGLKAMSFEVFELVYNTIRTQGGKVALSPSATIESCIYKMDDGIKISPDFYDEYCAKYGKGFSDIDCVYIKIKKDDVNRAVPFVENDIIYGYVNKISESGQYARGGQCIMEVVAADEGEVLGDMFIKAKLFPLQGTASYMVPVSSNIPPTDGMTVAQRGNTKGVKGRTSAFFIDTETSNWYMLDNLTSPVINDSNYYVVNGKLPKGLFDKIWRKYSYIKENDPVVYARYGIFENILQMDHQGNVIQRENNRGEWSSSIATDNTKDENGEYTKRYKYMADYYDVVTYNGELYKCVKSDTIEEPSKGSDWLLLVAKGNTPTIYTIEPSVTGIHLNREGVLNVTSLDVWVNRDGDEHIKIDDQYILDQLGLSVWFSIDNATERTRLIVGGSSIIELEEGGAVVVAEDSTGEIFITLEGEAIDISKIDEKINLHLIKDADEEGYGEELNKIYIPVTKDGKEGKEGPAGPSIYLDGDWKAGKTYKKENNCTPVVKYKAAGEDKKKYYILDTDEESINKVPSDLVHWKVFQYFQYLWSEFLLADFATLGGERGAVFYDKYLFSQELQGGVSYSEVEGNIFDDGNFREGYIPKFFVDFVSGLANISCLCEPYTTPTPTDGVIKIDMNGGFNVKVPFPKINTQNYTPISSMPIVVLPKFDSGSEWAKNGSHVEVMFESGGSEWGNFINTQEISQVYLKSLFVLVCVDDPRVNSDGTTNTEGITWPSFTWDEQDYIMHNGRRAKYLILGVGSSVRFKAVERNGRMYWTISEGANVTEEKVDVYSKKDGGTLAQAEDAKILPGDYNRVQFYGADYSTLTNLTESYYDYAVDTRGLMLYAGLEGFCPKNILFSSCGQYKIVDSQYIDSGFVTERGPILGN